MCEGFRQESLSGGEQCLSMGRGMGTRHAQPQNPSRKDVMGQLVYPAHGWLPPGASLSMQRDDQGKDFVTDWKGVIQAPGTGHCVTVPADNPFPNGFGPHYPVVQIDNGPFGGHQWYLGHTTAAVGPGQHFGFGEVLAHADQGHPSQIGISVPGDGGWVELGEWVGGPRPNAPSHWYDTLLATPLKVRVSDPPLKFGDANFRVLFMSARLVTCGYLPRAYFHFNSQVHGAVVAFKKHHNLPIPKPDGGVVDARTMVAIKHAEAWCKKNHKKEK